MQFAKTPAPLPDEMPGRRPAVSVLLPAYNAERYVRQAVESILVQTFADFELIVVDDGSTDRTRRILEEFEAADSRVRLVCRKNDGYVSALLLSVDLARGRYLARMDADDVAHPERFERQVAFMEAHKDVVVVGSSYELIDHRGRLLHAQHQPADDATLQSHCLAGTTPICHPTAMIRREAYDQVGGYEPATCPAEDLDLWLRLGEVGRLACLPELLLQYRLHPGSISETKQAKQIEAAKLACTKAAWRRGLPVSFKAGGGWRESKDTDGRLRQTLKYGWWAFNSGQRATALAYGIKAVRTSPMSRRAWTLLGCGAIKPMPAVQAPRPLGAIFGSPVFGKSSFGRPSLGQAA